MKGARGKCATAPVWVAATVIMCLVLSACSQRGLLNRISSPEDRALGATVIADLQHGPDADADLLSRLNAGLRGKLAGVLAQMHSATPNSREASSRLVDARTTVFRGTGGAWRQSFLAYEVSSGAKRALVRLVIVRQNGGVEIDSLYVSTLSAPVEKLGAFTLGGKSLVHYLMLALAVLSIATIVISEVVLVRTKGMKRKWLWFIGCLFGYGQLWIDWSTGALGFNPLYIQLLGAIATKAGTLAPWRVGWGLPIVSIIFLAQRRRLPRKPSPSQDLSSQRETAA